MAFVRTHIPCESCGSSNAAAMNEDGSSYCFSCGNFEPTAKDNTHTMTVTTPPTANGSFLIGKVLPLDARKINAETCQKFGYKIGKQYDKVCHIAEYRDLQGNLMAQKLRFEDKSFSSVGVPSTFFGQHLWPNGGRKLVVTEGEIDALSLSQVFGNKWPVVSLPTGAAAAKSAFKKNLEWLQKFDEVILMFDEDAAGRKAVEQVSSILPVGKCKVARLPLKDANEMLMQGKTEELVRSFWEAKIWRPDDIVEGSEVYDRLLNPKNTESIPYPFQGLNEKTRGIRKGEIVTVCAGSGIGKSQICRVIAHNLVRNTDKRIGYIALEESIERTASGIVGLELGCLLHLAGEIKETEQLRKAFDATVGSGRFFLYDHWGSLESDNLLGHIRYMAKALDVDYIVLDHLSIVVSGLGDGDERRMIDNTMTKLRSLVEECNIGMIVVSHLKRPEGKGHEDGAATSLAHLRGSAAIAQLSDIVLGLERNQQDPTNKNVTALRVLKNRFTGDTGLCCHLQYDKDTGRMEETVLEDSSEEQQDDDSSPF